ncbi:waprin-Thr1-like isoform X2 [Bacillus rossius redtenbacheri]|uniref:waprin-Thr1-like isoform X2 n=1 Tax=Bacillus rossius redtenbacheri TaxID=93214 RepID=UPI002FDCF255
MDSRMAIFFIIFMATVICSSAQPGSKTGFCPLKSTVQSCSPTCTSDYQCLGDTKCCPNVCGVKSCAGSGPVAAGGSKYGGSESVYCGNVKCSGSEKCGYDKSSKREKCVPK